MTNDRRQREKEREVERKTGEKQKKIKAVARNRDVVERIDFLFGVFWCWFVGVGATIVVVN